jgi:tRNA pseudouridine38-40 synthase
VQDWRITLAWDGRRFCGWQRQPNVVTIQQVVEESLAAVLGGASVTVTASGRTDAGVHALAQVASFQTDVPRSPVAIRNGLNFHLPPEIVCLDASHAPPDFNARAWSRSKLYRYRILAHPVRCPFRDGKVWHIKKKLDVRAMAEAVKPLEGAHDFSSFRASGCTAAHARRFIVSATVTSVDSDEIHMEFVGNGFLRHQVRVMAGTLVQVGLGRFTPARIATILAARDRCEAGRTAPAAGLWLVRVETGDGPINPRPPQ